VSTDVTRRDFLKCSLAAGGCLFAGSSLLSALAQTDDEEKKFIAPARYFEKLDAKRIQCNLCPRECSVGDLERGACGVRENRDGDYLTLVHSRACSANVDPIEKKPLFHYLPGTLAFSIATAGCNIECRFCQNWQISQFRPEQVRSFYLPPAAVTQAAASHNCPTIAYTYTEPVIFYEYMYDTAAHARAKKVGSVMISNGYIKPQPMKDLCSQLTGVKVDLKAFTDDFYVKYCSGHLKPVLDVLVLLREIGMWTEIVVLLIPGLNDSPKEITEMSKWIVKNLGRDVPVHFTRFHASYKMKNLPDTPHETVERARQIAMGEGINFVYTGNVRPGHPGEQTYCPACNELLIKRFSYHVLENRIQSGKCPKCGAQIPGIWVNPLA